MAGLASRSAGDWQMPWCKRCNVLGHHAIQIGRGRTRTVASITANARTIVHVGRISEAGSIADRRHRQDAGVRANVAILAIQISLGNVIRRRRLDNRHHRVGGGIGVADLALLRQIDIAGVVNVGNRRHDLVTGVLVARGATRRSDRNMSGGFHRSGKTTHIAAVAIGALARNRVRCVVLN